MTVASFLEFCPAGGKAGESTGKPESDTAERGEDQKAPSPMGLTPHSSGACATHRSAGLNSQ